MAKVVLTEEAASATPTAGTGILSQDSTVSRPTFKADDGVAGVMSGLSANAAIIAQTGFTADAYLANSDLQIPSFGMQIKLQIEFIVSLSKTAAGIVAPTFSVRIGAARSTADTARVQVTTAAQTAAADVGIFTVRVTLRNIGAAGVLQASATVVSGAGFGGVNTVEATGAGFDTTTQAGNYIGLSVNGGAAAAWTVTQVQARAIWG